MKAGLMSFIASDQHVGKRGSQATHDNDGDAVCVDELAVTNSRTKFSKDEWKYTIPVTPHVIIYQTQADAIESAVTQLKTVGHVRRAATFGRRKNLRESIGETLFAPRRMMSPLSAFDPAVHKIVEAKKYEQDMTDLSLFREKMGQMIEDELAALSDFEDFDETPTVHMSAGADGIFRPNT